IKALREAGADEITAADNLPSTLQVRLTAVLATRKRFADRWEGLVDDLTEAGRDDSRSGADMSVAAMAKGAGFSNIDAGLMLCAFKHGKTNGEEWSDDARLRHVARCVLRSHTPAFALGVNALIVEFNGKFMVVSEADKAVIYRPKYDQALHRRYFERISFED